MSRDLSLLSRCSHMNSIAPRGPLVWLLLMITLAGCTTNYYRKSADKETYHTIAAQSPLVNNMDPNFTIEETNGVPLDGYPVATNVPDFLGPDGQDELGSSILRLED